MDTLFSPNTSGDTSSVSMEVVQKQKQELTLFGSFLRNRTHKLYAYNTSNSSFKEVDVDRSSTIHALVRDGKLVPVDLEMEKVLIDSRNIYFEALNDRNAIKRIKRWRSGLIKELFNLKKYNPDTNIDFFKKLV